MSYTGKFEFAAERRYRERNTRLYRLAHWPIWIWVFFLAPGPLTFSMFSRGFHWINWSWLAAVLIGTGIAGLRGRLPGVEPRPYILRFDEDRPNPLYRRVCYTFAWNAVLSFTLLNMTGLLLASATGVWHLKQIYYYAYSPLCAIILLLGIMGKLPRVGPSTKGEGVERRYFYGSVWAATAAHVVLLLLWRVLPETRSGNFAKLVVFGAVLAAFGVAASRGHASHASHRIWRADGLGLTRDAPGNGRSRGLQAPELVQKTNRPSGPETKGLLVPRALAMPTPVGVPRVLITLIPKKIYFHRSLPII